MRYILILFFLVYIGLRISRAVISFLSRSGTILNSQGGAKKSRLEKEKPPWDEKDVIDADYKEIK